MIYARKIIFIFASFIILLTLLFLSISVSTVPAEAATENDLTRVGMSVFSALIMYRVLICVICALVVALIIVMILWSKSKKKTLEKVQRALVAAEQASEAKGNFMSKMSHEIRTPLNAIIGYSSIARDCMESASTEEELRQASMKVVDCLAKSDVASRHLLTIINDVLDMSAIESGKIGVENVRFNFKSLLSSLTAIFYQQSLAKNLNFEVIIKGLTEEWFLGDQMRGSQILANLLSNAIKFTPENGRVTLTVSVEEQTENTTFVHFSVTDTGIGMSKEYLDHLFTPFEQADSSISRRFGGTGLGLSITKNLVDLMGGKITVESQQGVGSTFDVILPLTRTDQPKGQSIFDFSNVNALVVDDDTAVCDYVKMLFDRFGARCTVTTSGINAVRLCNEANAAGSQFSLCLLDWRMPGMDGLETARKIREIVGEELPIIVITAYDFSEIRERAAEVGVNMFLSKPLFQSSLFDLLVDVCGDDSLKKPDKERLDKCYDFGGKRVLLAEDNEMNMEIAKSILETSNLKVDCVMNGRDAVEKFCESAPDTYELILMDVQMPIMDGYTATRTIRSSSHPEATTIPILAMTADAFAENVAEARNAGMDAHISKPIDIHNLFLTLKDFIEQAK